VYDRLDFASRLGVGGDCYDRYLCARSRRCANPTAIISSASNGCARIPARSSRRSQDCTAFAGADEEQHGRIDPSSSSLPKHALAEGGGLTQDRASEGHFGIYVISDGANKPYRLKIRAQALPISRPWATWQRVTCSPTRLQFIARWTSFLARLTADAIRTILKTIDAAVASTRRAQAIRGDGSACSGAGGKRPPFQRGDGLCGAGSVH